MATCKCIQVTNSARGGTKYYNVKDKGGMQKTRKVLCEFRAKSDYM